MVVVLCCAAVAVVEKKMKERDPYRIGLAVTMPSIAHKSLILSVAVSVVVVVWY